MQSSGALNVNVVSTLTGPYGPLLWRVAEAVTLKGALMAMELGATTVTPVTFTSAAVVMLVLALPEPELLPELESLTCSWSIAAAAATEKLWLDGLVQVTDHEAGTAGTVVTIETASDESCIVCGLVEEVVQSPGKLRVSVVSAFTGP